MKPIIRVAFVMVLMLLTACRNRQKESFEFNENTLSVIDNKLHEFEGLEKLPPGDTIYPIFIANLLDDSVVYDDTRLTILQDSTSQKRFESSKILNHKSRETDIYRISFIGNSGADDHILLINGANMSFINMKQPYEDVIKAILNFFDRNENIDRRLMPMFIQRITWWYLRNHWSDERGEWYDWFNKQDPVSREYYPFQYPR